MKESFSGKNRSSFRFSAPTMFSASVQKAFKQRSDHSEPIFPCCTMQKQNPKAVPVDWVWRSLAETCLKAEATSMVPIHPERMGPGLSMTLEFLPAGPMLQKTPAGILDKPGCRPLKPTNSSKRTFFRVINRFDSAYRHKLFSIVWREKYRQEPAPLNPAFARRMHQTLPFRHFRPNRQMDSAWNAILFPIPSIHCREMPPGKKKSCPVTENLSLNQRKSITFRSLL